MAPLALLGIAILAAHFWPERWHVQQGVNDFLGLYAGARLVGSPGQYNPERYKQEQIAATGWFGESLLYTRLPAFAIPLRPLGGMPYQHALRLWLSILVLCAAAFILIWPARDRPLLALACCGSFPLAAALVNGQDVPILLVLIAFALRFAERRPFLAGCILALCGVKYHLFFALPPVLATQRRWRMLGGLAAAGAAILALCFAVAGPGWPAEYLKLVTSGVTNPDVRIMPNLRGLVEGLPHAVAFEILLAGLVVAAACFIAARSGFSVGFAAALLGGVLISHHAYIADLALLIPALLTFAGKFPTMPVRVLCGALLLPVWFLLPSPVLPLTAPVPLMLLALTGSVAFALKSHSS
ncbi:MAG: glycosyltransferase family 87 protein [Acidobacteriota bacterium]